MKKSNPIYCYTFETLSKMRILGNLSIAIKASTTRSSSENFNYYIHYHEVSVIKWGRGLCKGVRN